MQAFGIPRLDAGAEGIHLIWTWPPGLPLSEGGYDVQRLIDDQERWRAQCETIDKPIIDQLRARGEYLAPLGPLRLRSGVRFAPITEQTLLPPPAETGLHPTGLGDAPAEIVAAGLARLLAGSPLKMHATEGAFDVFVQELPRTVERATVQAVGQVAITIALSAGKAVAVSVGGSPPATMDVSAPGIDTVVVYVVAPQSVEICAYERISAGSPADPWSAAPYVARGLTLPVREADATLTSPGKEFAAAKGRLVGGETLAQANFEQLAATLRSPAAAAGLGRSGERVVLVRSDATQSYEELPFEVQLSALALHPRVRRILGFGFADRVGLEAGKTYSYRITGRFASADLTDVVYDVQRVPASTVLPAAFAIRDLSLRFQTPVKVVLDPAPSATALQTVSRRGILVDTSGHDGSWLLPSLDSWSAVISLPAPVDSLMLEVAPGHDFTYAAGLPWAFGSPPALPLPPGPRAELAFGTPVMEVRLGGKGTLYAVRVPSSQSGTVAVHAYAGPITYAPQTLPAPPVALTAYGFQQAQTILDGAIDESTAVPTRPPSGFMLNWLPAAVAGLGVWPNDLNAGPPLDGLAYQIEHRTVQPPATFGPWEPISGDDNLSVGSRDTTAPSARLGHGSDLDELFPAVRGRSAGAGYALHLSDVFGEQDPTTGQVRPAQPLGSYHQYQIRTVDAVGRISSTTTLSNIARLEKNIPPPLPAGPQPESPPDLSGHLRASPGPRARAIVAGAPGLTAADLAILGAHQNAILLEWGWRQQERDLDPTTAEFRVYLSRPQDVVSGKIVDVTSAPPDWKVALSTDRPLVVGELVGQWITSGDYPFRVVHNEAGAAPALLVEASRLQPARQPLAGPVRFGRPPKPRHRRPSGWDERVAVYPLTSSDTYSHVFYDLLTLTPEQPSDALWVGVSAADAEPYVADERTSGPNAPRPGNESAIAASAVGERYRGQPTFSVPPPLGDVPELVTDEPTGRQVLASLDLTALLGGSLSPGSPVTLNRCAVDAVIGSTSVSNGQVVLDRPDGGRDTIVFTNPNDEAAVLATLGSSEPHRLANRYVLHLVVASSDPGAFFERVRADLDRVGVVDDRLAPKAGRYLYMVRAADALGHVSSGSAILPVVVRVPSTAAAVTPHRRALATTDHLVTLTVAIGADHDTTTALLFAAVTPPGATPPVQGDADLLRLPNRRDLYPKHGLRLRLSDGTLVEPAAIKDLADADVTVEPDGTRVATLSVGAQREAWVALWCYGLTRDGFPSFTCGPFGTGVRA